MSYNGWSNRETWLVNLHYSPESRADVEVVREDFYERLHNLDPLMCDLMQEPRVNWDELIAACEEEEEENE